MTYREAIDTIRVAQAEVEWNYPLDYAIAFEKAIEALKYMKDNFGKDEIIRCGNCANYENSDIGWCKVHSKILPTGDWTMFSEDDFCSFAEPRR